MKAKPRVLISLPNRHWLRAEVSAVGMKLLGDGRYKTRIIHPTHKPYEENLHRIRNEMMRDGWDFWLNIDADNPPENNPLDLVELDLPLIGLPTPIWHVSEKHRGDRPIYLNAYRFDGTSAYKEHHPQAGLQRVDAIGTGCFLVHRRVFEHPDLPKAPFAREWTGDGLQRKGNDVAFCERVARCGFEIYAHFGYICEHYCELGLLEVLKRFHEFYKEGKGR